MSETVDTKEAATAGEDLVAIRAQAGPVARQQVRTVELADDAGPCLQDPRGEPVPARRAVSCLIEPAAGDKVLTAEAGGQVYVLAVLERPDEALPLHIDTKRDLRISANRISLKTGVFDLVTDAANLVGNAFNSLFRTSKRVTGTDETIAQSSTVSAQQRVSVIAGSDVHKAGVFQQSVESAASQSAHVAVVTAKTDIRLNAERINVG